MRCFDVQVNGAFGVDFSAPDLTGDQFLRTAEKILQAGVTRFLPTVITSSMAVYQENLPCIVKAVEKAGLTYEIPGFHL
jgi:N-acetylglucosamine-6-phosphate deacetylase